MGSVGVICWLWIQKKTAFENLNADAACDELGRAAMPKWTKWNNWNRAKVLQAVQQGTKAVLRWKVSGRVLSCQKSVCRNI